MKEGVKSGIVRAISIGIVAALFGVVIIFGAIPFYLDFRETPAFGLLKEKISHPARHMQMLAETREEDLIFIHLSKDRKVATFRDAAGINKALVLREDQVSILSSYAKGRKARLLIRPRLLPGGAFHSYTLLAIKDRP